MTEADFTDQKVVVYTDARQLVSGARTQSILDLYIHTMVTHHGPRGEELVVVYRKAKE
jgi:hypothetical protein